VSWLEGLYHHLTGGKLLKPSVRIFGLRAEIRIHALLSSELSTGDYRDRELFSYAPSRNGCMSLLPDSVALTNLHLVLEESGSPAEKAAYRSMVRLNKLVVKLGYKILNMNGKFCIRNKLFEKQSTADENICR
jgi:hypothetical protein